MGRALVTGGAGLVGSHLVDLLLERGYDVRILDNLEPTTHPNGKPPWIPADAEFVEGDICDLGGPDRRGWSLMRDCDLVFHQAAFGGFAPNAAMLMTETNALGTVRVMEAAANAGVRKVVVASSQAVYGHGWGWDGENYNLARRDPANLAQEVWEPIDPHGGNEPMLVETLHEGMPVDLPTPYALSKYYAERAALVLGEQWRLPVVALRYALTYGPRQSVSNPYTGIVSIFTTRLRNGLPPVVYEDGLQTRDLTYVEDVARANLLVALDDRADGEVFNVGTGVATTVLDVAWTLGETLGLSIRPERPGSYRPGDARHVVTDSSRLHGLGWEPQVDVAEGLRRYIEWALEQPSPPEVFTNAEAGLREAGVVRG